MMTAPALQYDQKFADSRWHNRIAPYALALLLVHSLPLIGAAETLAEAMQAAVNRSPALLAEQARSRAARAGIDIASSGYYPRVTASGDLGASSGNIGLNAGSDGPSGIARSDLTGTSGARWGYSLNAELPLFDGWRTQSAVGEARAGADGALAQVLVAESSVLLEVVTAFADVVRNRQTERLRHRNMQAVEDEVKTAITRMQRGTATETDVAQARARHAQAIADLIVAKSDAKVGVAEYRRAIGHEPGMLQPPDVPEAILPPSLEAAAATAEAQNQAVMAANLKADASQYSIERFAADGLPQVKLRGGFSGDNALASGIDDRNGASVTVRVVVPLYDGGETAARIEQARQLNVSLTEDARNVRERVRNAVFAAWSRLVSGRDRLVAERQAVAANRRALDSIREEIKLGQRSTVEALDAQRELVASEVRAVSSQRDIIVAAYSLLMATGQLSLRHRDDTGKPDVAFQESDASRGNAWQPLVTRE